MGMLGDCPTTDMFSGLSTETPNAFLKVYFIFNYVRMVCGYPRKPWASDPLELEIQAVTVIEVSCSIWALETDLWYSASSVRALSIAEVSLHPSISSP